MADSYDFGDRYERNAQEPQRGGKKREGIFDFGGKEVKFYKPSFDKEADSNINRIDIVPYIITSSKHPLVASGSWKKDKPDYMLEVCTHKSVGPDFATVICPRETYGKKCPICDKMFEAYKAGDKKAGNALRAKRRSIYNVISRNQGDTDEIMIWDVSYAWAEKRMIEAKKMEENVTGKKINHASPITGNTIAFNATLSDLTTKDPIIEPKEFRFLPRETSLVPYIEKAYPLDAMLKVHTFEELEAMLYATDDSDDEPSEREPMETEEVGTPAKEEPSMECPYDRRFGIDTDCFAECDTCSAKNKEVWRACDRANRK